MKEQRGGICVDELIVFVSFVRNNRKKYKENLDKLVNSLSPHYKVILSNEEVDYDRNLISDECRWFICLFDEYYLADGRCRNELQEAQRTRREKVIRVKMDRFGLDDAYFLQFDFDTLPEMITELLSRDLGYCKSGSYLVI